ncbi:MAG: type I DNA topoisomerase, partial [Firmicutes bacterium]|nr:type I DNA topoisomerase [Bacillota bacterium]
MSRPLIIVESPAKAKTIEKFLGKRYSVKASLGHLRDLPKSQLGVDVEKGFLPKYIAIRGKGEIIKELKEAAKKASSVLLATDPDREGEAISWHLAYLLGLNEERPCRIEFHEITKEAIQKAVKKPREINQSLVDAQQARRVLDRLVGYKLSPLLWRKVRPGLSAGRVQSVAVRLICDREEEIRNFVQEEYWTLSGLFARDDGARLAARYQGRGEEKAEIKSREEMDRLLRALPRGDYRVESVKRKEKKRLPASPFTTSTLQQEASRKLGFSSRRTMAVAQQLYEGLDLGAAGTTGLVTYIRTDSTRVAAEAAQEAQSYIKGKYGEAYAQAERRREGKKVGVQGAHEAIRPTSVLREPEAIKGHLARDQYRLYRLIWERFLASQMSPGVYDTVTADITSDKHIFRATGSTVKFPGFMILYLEGEDEEARKEKEEGLPELAEGESLHLLSLDPEQHFTQPP